MNAAEFPPGPSDLGAQIRREINRNVYGAQIRRLNERLRIIDEQTKGLHDIAREIDHEIKRKAEDEDEPE